MTRRGLEALKAKPDAVRRPPASALRNCYDELILSWTYSSNTIEGIRLRA